MDNATSIFNGKFSWAERSEWLAPSVDIAEPGGFTKFFMRPKADVQIAVEAALPYLKQRRTCLQAGGYIGIWPTMLSGIFNRVITFEAQEITFGCLRHNTKGLDNVTVMPRCALGKDNTLMVGMGNWVEKGHFGTSIVIPGGNIPTVCIDDLELTDVDLIWLDIEGSEYDALVGASETIERCRPVIGFEDTGLNTRIGYSDGASPIEYLISYFGYKEKNRPYPSDALMIP
jgi:FkbM family methyltransferase